MNKMSNNSKLLKRIFDSLTKDDFGTIRKKVKYRFKSRKNIFNEIYKNNAWGSKESVSGPGSDLWRAQSIIIELPLLLKILKIKSILDAPCGDFNWMSKVELDAINYKGMDIVNQIIINNNLKFAKENIQFEYGDFINAVLPKVDLIISRDCFIHFSFNEISKSIKNFKKSGSKFLLTNTYPDVIKNINIVVGAWRPINLEIKPFNFPAPITYIEEKENYNPNYGKKYLALWSINTL